MRNVYLFMAASLGCLMVAGMSMISPAAIALDFMSPGRSECSNLLESYGNGREMPKPGTAEYARYADCYKIICESGWSW